MAAPQGASSGPGSCGGAPTAIRGRVRSCRFAPSGPKTPGAKILRAAITISRCGGIGITAVTGSSATTTSTISSSKSITTPAHGYRRPRQRGIFAFGPREFFSDRGVRFNDKGRDAAAAAATGAANEDCDWVRVTTSLRANGSRECAPEDRLREAIQKLCGEVLDCFVAYAPCNDEAARAPKIAEPTRTCVAPN